MVGVDGVSLPRIGIGGTLRSSDFGAEGGRGGDRSNDQQKNYERKSSEKKTNHFELLVQHILLQIRIDSSVLIHHT